MRIGRNATLGYSTAVHLAEFLQVPGLALFGYTVNWDRLLNNYVIPIGILLLIFLAPHIIAARIFSPRSEFWKILVACVTQVAFVLSILFALILVAALGPMYLAAGSAVLFVLSTLVMVGIYRFEFPHGLGYTAVVLALAAGVTWGVAKGLPEEKVNRYVMPIMIGLESSRFRSEQDARRAALEAFPALGVAGSPFNQKFIEKHRTYQRQRPDLLAKAGWPWLIANEVSWELKVKRLPVTLPAVQL